LVPLGTLGVTLKIITREGMSEVAKAIKLVDNIADAVT
jgi:hypothetical protein